MTLWFMGTYMQNNIPSIIKLTAHEVKTVVYFGKKNSPK